MGDNEDPIEQERRAKKGDLALAPGEGVYLVMRVVTFRGGEVTQFPVQVFEAEDKALEQAQALTEALAGLMPLALCEIAGQRQVRNTGLTAMSLLADIGMVGIDHKVYTMKVLQGEGSIATAAGEAAATGETVSDGGIILL